VLSQFNHSYTTGRNISGSGPAREPDSSGWRAGSSRTLAVPTGAHLPQWKPMPERQMSIAGPSPAVQSGPSLLAMTVLLGIVAYSLVAQWHYAGWTRPMISVTASLRALIGDGGLLPGAPLETPPSAWARLPGAWTRMNSPAAGRLRHHIQFDCENRKHRRAAREVQGGRRHQRLQTSECRSNLPVRPRIAKSIPAAMRRHDSGETSTTLPSVKIFFEYGDNIVGPEAQPGVRR